MLLYLYNTGLTQMSKILSCARKKTAAVFCVVSGIYAGGVQYLDPADSERAERDNFNAGRIVCYVFIAVGCVLIAASVPFCIRLVKLKKQLERDIH